MAINAAKIEEVVNSQAFAESLKGAQSIEDIQAAFAANGADLTVDEVVRVASDIMAENGAEELSADDLDTVSGGCNSDLEHALFKLATAFPNWVIGKIGGGAIKPITCNCGRKW